MEQEKRLESLQRNQRGWTAGLAACRSTQTLESEKADIVKAAMKGIVQRLDALQQRLFESAESAKKLSLQCMDRLHKV